MIFARLLPVNRRYFYAALAVLAVVVMVLAGCESNTSFVPVSDPNATAATFVGPDSNRNGTNGICSSCHSEIASQYETQNHGLNFRVVHGDQIDGYNGGCAPCHTTGYGEESGFVPGGSTPQLENIGCQECHGPASKHVASPSEDNINRIPDAENTCWDCHVNTYKELKNNPQAMTDAGLYNTKPKSVAVHHPQALFLAGMKAYNRNNEPDAHRFVRNNCVTCHLQPHDSPVAHNDESLEPDMEACASCHANASALKTELQEEIKAKLIQVGGESATEPGEPDETGSGGMLGAYMAAHPEIDWNTNSSPDSQVVKNFKGARYNWDFVLADKSEGVHNPGLANRLLDDAISLLQLPE